MEIVRSIVAVLKKLRLRKFIVCVYTNEFPIPIMDMDGIVIKTAPQYSKNKYSEINVGLNKGTCYYVELNNKLSHFSWLYKNNLLAKQLNLDEYWTIGNCKTDEKFKGKGLYGKVVSAIITSYPDRKFALFIEPDNVASINGVTKIGLKCTSKFEITRFLGLALKVKKLND